MALAKFDCRLEGDNGSINDAIYDYTVRPPTGAGVIQSFLRVQANGVEQGYNTSGGRFPSMIRPAPGCTT